MAATARRTSPKNEARVLALLQQGDVGQLAKLFQRGTDPNLVLHAQLKQPRGGASTALSAMRLQLPLLHIASSSGSWEVAKCLLEHGAAVDCRDRYGTSAVHWAAASGHVNILQLLHRHGGDMDSADRLGMTPLHIAAHAGRTRALKFLLRIGADCAAQTQHGELPLDLARKENNANCQRVLHKALVARAAADKANANAATPSTELEPGAHEAEHDRSGTMVVHSDGSALRLFDVETESPEVDADADNAVASEMEALRAQNDLLEQQALNLKAETARLTLKAWHGSEQERLRRAVECERERLYDLKQSHQLNRSILQSQRQKLKREAKGKGKGRRRKSKAKGKGGRKGVLSDVDTEALKT